MHTSFEISACARDRQSLRQKDVKAIAKAVKATIDQSLPIVMGAYREPEVRFVVKQDAVYAARGFDFLNMAVVLYGDADNLTMRFVRKVQATLDALELESVTRWNAPTQDMPVDYDSLSMFSVEGADQLRTTIAHARETRPDFKILSEENQSAVVQAIQDAVSEAGFGEVYDTAVREVIWDRLEA